jgi:hypothetical protein
MLDSACKHIQQCRISYDHMLDFVGNSHEIQRNKMQYCVHKDEMVVGISRPWAKETVRQLPPSAYPRILSCLGDINFNEEYMPLLKMIKYVNHFSTSIRKREEIIDQMKSRPHHTVAHHNPGGTHVHYLSGANGNALDLHKYIPKMFDYYPVGIANTLGYAHPNSGDTMSSVMIGGLRTIMNGDFEVYAGDLIQWYWTFEKDCFHPITGKRKSITDAAGTVHDGWDPEVDCMNLAGVGGAGGGAQLSDRDIQRHLHNDLQYGRDPLDKKPANKAKNVARIKPYMRDDEQPRIYDWFRVFAVAINSARPHEMLDIKISRQSM